MKRDRKPGPSGAEPPDRSDSALWRAVTEDVKPLTRREGRRPTTPEAVPAKPVPPEMPNARAAKRVAGPAGAPVQPAAKPTPELAPGQRAGVDRRTAERLRKGRLPIEGRLDLHGLTREAAYEAVNRFIISAHAARKRCVLIVTGKGRGILQSETPRWLNHARLRDKIVSIETARPQDGGGGALYILLKRHRETSR